jgi:hypothetical protein
VRDGDGNGDSKKLPIKDDGDDDSSDDGDGNDREMNVFYLPICAWWWRGTDTCESGNAVFCFSQLFHSLPAVVCTAQQFDNSVTIV